MKKHKTLAAGSTGLLAIAMAATALAGGGGSATGVPDAEVQIEKALKTADAHQVTFEAGKDGVPRQLSDEDASKLPSLGAADLAGAGGSAGLPGSAQIEKALEAAGAEGVTFEIGKDGVPRQLSDEEAAELFPPGAPSEAQTMDDIAEIEEAIRAANPDAVTFAFEEDGTLRQVTGPRETADSQIER